MENKRLLFIFILGLIIGIILFTFFGNPFFNHILAHHL
ncbi:hypothetical protein EDC33_0494 [Salinicoccus roseus]|nr:hypothetical protein EDC33_0494 [Salinicoccus roseus]